MDGQDKRFTQSWSYYRPSNRYQEDIFDELYPEGMNFGKRDLYRQYSLNEILVGQRSSLVDLLKSFYWNKKEK